jgi:flagellar biosynthetic protein FlhB
MMEQVPRADVVLTNPTHYAVALRYDAEQMRAPVVVAKGSDRVALRIREIAREHGVLMLESPLLARALYRHGELDQPIPMDLYLVVAQVLAYVYQLRHRPEQAPMRPSFDVPTAYATTAEGAVDSGPEGAAGGREPNWGGRE